MERKIKAYAAREPRGKLEPFEFNAGELRPEQVEIKVSHCGICHSDLSMRDNEWQMTVYPFVPGHEAVGEIVAIGDQVKNLKIGERVGLGWVSESDMTCPQCLSGNQNLCQKAEQTIVGRPGAFADRVRCHWSWAIKLPDAIDASKAGPLFCGGITVFNPMLQFNVKATDKVGVIGIGGLGHLALQFLNKWGCEVTAFTSSTAKADEARLMGAHFILDSRSDSDLGTVAGKFDFIISTVSANLNWLAFLNTLAPKGRLHFVGLVPEPVSFATLPLIDGQKTVSGTPLGSPATITKMLEFCARHDIAPVTESFKMSETNEAFEHLRAGKARYRIVLENGIGV
jgi:alcohol/geraniol dehydrogenase (NADP+)